MVERSPKKSGWYNVSLSLQNVGEKLCGISVSVFMGQQG